MLLLLLLLLILLYIDTPVTGPSPTPTGPLSTLGDDITATACTFLSIIHLAAHTKRIKLHYTLGHIYTYCILLMKYIQYVCKYSVFTQIHSIIL